MPVKIFHTADVHIGMKFTRGYDPGVRDGLIEARIQTLRSMIESANTRNCDLFVVAGDLFNSGKPLKGDILKVTDILGGFEGKVVLVLPGNHDHLQSDGDDLWTKFHDVMKENTKLLSQPQTYDLKPYDLDMIVYAAPCRAKHSKLNAIRWIKETPKDPKTKFHVGIAHGSMEDLSPDFNQDYYPMTHGELLAAGMDLWLMGHTHNRYPDSESGHEGKIFFPSTPEPDGFDCTHGGYAWFIELNEDKSLSYQSVPTGRYEFLTIEKDVFTDQDVESLRSFFKTLDSKKHLMKLKLKGRVSGKIHDERDTLLKELEKQVLYLEPDLSDLLRQITIDDINREFTEGSFPYRFLKELALDEKSPIALQMAYNLIRDIKP